MSAETKTEHAFPLHHFKNDEDVKFIAEHGTLKGNKVTLNKKATETFFDKHGYTSEMRATASSAERKLNEASARAALELMEVRVREGKKEKLTAEELEKIQTEVVITDPNYKMEARLTGCSHGRNPANGERLNNYGQLRFKHELKNAVDKSVFDKSAEVLKTLLQG